MPKLDQKRIVRVSKASTELISNWREGVSIEADSGHLISEVCLSAAAARLRLAYEMARAANTCMNCVPALPRSAISRFYYAMYHSLRASAFVFHKGDDYEKHSKLPGGLPEDFPDKARWANQLKSAKEYRNRADYDPQPSGTRAWQPIAETLRDDAKELLPIARRYLKDKGCIL